MFIINSQLKVYKISCSNTLVMNIFFIREIHLIVLNKYPFKYLIIITSLLIIIEHLKVYVQYIK